jgi:ATP-binding cassette subfamily B protein
MHPYIRKSIELNSFDYLIHHNYDYFQTKEIGEISNSINNMGLFIQPLISNTFYLFHLISTAIFCSFLFFKIKLIFGLYFLIWVFIFFGISLYFIPKITLSYKEIAIEESSKSGLNVDIFSNILSVKLCNNELNEKKRLEIKIDNIKQEEQKIALYSWYIWTFFEFGFLILLYLIFTNLVTLKINNLTSIGDFSISISALSLIYGVISSFKEYIINILTTWSKIKSSFDILINSECNQKNINPHLILKNPKIEFKNVSFKYSENIKTKTINNLSFNINAGQKIGIVGLSGSGKTTIINLILGVLKPTKGLISIDDINIQQVSRTNLNNFISLVQQEAILFNRSIKENILYGNPGATEAEMINAAKLAYAHDFIMNLEHRYETIAGERGMKLSGGQRQRIIIARAFLKNSPLLLLDEATASLDSETEKLIQESLKKLSKAKTTIMIAHRLSTLIHCDIIIVLEKGTILEQGTHQQLIENDGLYKNLWDKQTLL